MKEENQLYLYLHLLKYSSISSLMPYKEMLNHYKCQQIKETAFNFVGGNSSNF